MPLDPEDVSQKQFKVAFRGYALDEVDAFLDEVEAELRRLLRDNAELRAVPDARSGSTADGVDRPPAGPAPATTGAVRATEPGQSQEAALRTLVLAQRTADEVVAEAREEAGRLLAESTARSERLDAEASARAASQLAELEDRRVRLEGHIEQLRAFEREYRTRLKAYLEEKLGELGGVATVSEGGAAGVADDPPGEPGASPAAGRMPTGPDVPGPADDDLLQAALLAAAPTASPAQQDGGRDDGVQGGGAVGPTGPAGPARVTVVPDEGDDGAGPRTAGGRESTSASHGSRQLTVSADEPPGPVTVVPSSQGEGGRRPGA